MYSCNLAKRKSVLCITALAISFLAHKPSYAQSFPNKPVKIIVTAAPGGTTDIASRALSDVLGKELGQPVIVENKAGGAGIIGIQALLAAPADGYTMAMGNIGPNAINYSLYKNLPYKMEDMEPVTVVIATPNVLVVNPEVPAKTVAELVALAKAHPGKYSFASSIFHSIYLLLFDLFFSLFSCDLDQYLLLAQQLLLYKSPQRLNAHLSRKPYSR